jgi:metal-responsive CopG/Arc/MetJ family transcriptional regulator
MQSQLTVRLPDELDKEISSLAKRLHLKRSDIIRMALKHFLEDFQGARETKPYEQVKSLIGNISSGIPDLGEAHRKYLLKQFKKRA